jgi:uncharacterized protein YuzE
MRVKYFADTDTALFYQGSNTPPLCGARRVCKYSITLADDTPSACGGVYSLEFLTNPPVETREVNENIYVDLDNKGRVVSLTIEHAGQSADMNEFLFQRIPAS